MRSALALPLVLIASLLASCGSDSPTTPTSTTTTSPVTETFASSFGPLGASARQFSVASTGTVIASLDSAGPPADVIVGFGLGTPRADGHGCVLTYSMVTAAGGNARFQTTADAGPLCVQVYDVGNAKGTLSFTVTITHP